MARISPKPASAKHVGDLGRASAGAPAPSPADRIRNRRRPTARRPASARTAQRRAALRPSGKAPANAPQQSQHGRIVVIVKDADQRDDVGAARQRIASEASAEGLGARDQAIRARSVPRHVRDRRQIEQLKTQLWDSAPRLPR